MGETSGDEPGVSSKEPSTSESWLDELLPSSELTGTSSSPGKRGVVGEVKVKSSHGREFSFSDHRVDFLVG